MDLNKTKQKKAKQIKGEQKRHDAKLFDLSMRHLSNPNRRSTVEHSRAKQDKMKLT